MKEKIKQWWNNFVAWFKANWKHLLTLGLTKLLEWLKSTNELRKLKKEQKKKEA